MREGPEPPHLLAGKHPLREYADRYTLTSGLQELKDFGRLLGGDVAFCDIDRETRTQGLGTESAMRVYPYSH